MSEIVGQSLQKIAKGTGIIFTGTIIGMLLTLAGRVLLARSFTQAEYGIFSLALIIFYILVEVSLFGIQDGAARQIGYYRGKNDTLKVKGIVSSSIQIVLVASVILSIILFFTSDILSAKVFHEPALAIPLQVFAFAIPFLALIHILVSIFRGFESVKERVYIQNILRNVTFLLFLIPVILFSFPFINAIYVFTASIVITFVAFVFYVIRKSPFSLKATSRNIFNNPARKELLFFSLPLLGAFMMDQILSWADTLMLGYFKTSDTVGLYNAAVPLARIIVTFLYSSYFIFIPIIAKLYSQNLIPELKRNYQILTKWILFVVLPPFFAFVLFPEVILSSIFGAGYALASSALQILAICFLIHVALGPSSAAVVSMGKVKFAMAANSIGASLNILLNAILIPIWGINGAAIATAISLVTTHGLYSIRLYQISRTHPFTKNYIVPLLISSLATFFIYIFTRGFFSSSIWLLVVFAVILTATYIVVLLLSKSIDKEDIMLLLAIEERAGLNLAPIKNVLKRFV